MKISTVKIAKNSEIRATKTTDLLITSNELLMTAIKMFILLPCRLPEQTKSVVVDPNLSKLEFL